MANKKNRRQHRNGHWHVFWSKITALKCKQHNSQLHTIRKKLTPITKQASTSSQQQTIPITNTSPNPSNTSQSASPTPSSTTLPSTNNEQTVTIEGSRIINIEKLSNYINDITIHASTCGGNIILTGEKRYGLASVLSSKCNGCGYEVVLETSRKVKGPSEYQRWECNLAAVWGQMVTGGGHFPLESMSVLGVPVMNKSCFQQTEREIGEWWTTRLEQAMAEARQEEKRLAK